MRAIAEFVKTTLIGGLLIVLPVYIAVLLILKAVQGLVTAVKPITAAIPGSVEFEETAAKCYCGFYPGELLSGDRGNMLYIRRYT